MLTENYILNNSYDNTKIKIDRTIKTFNKERFINDIGIYGKKSKKHYKLFYRFKKIDKDEINPRSLQEDWTVDNIYVCLSINELSFESTNLQFELIDNTTKIKKQLIFIYSPIIILFIWVLSFSGLITMGKMNNLFAFWVTILCSFLLSIGAILLFYLYYRKIKNYDKEEIFRNIVDELTEKIRK